MYYQGTVGATEFALYKDVKYVKCVLYWSVLLREALLLNCRGQITLTYSNIVVVMGIPYAL